jgi:hypothetical protein
MLPPGPFGACDSVDASRCCRLQSAATQPDLDVLVRQPNAEQLPARDRAGLKFGNIRKLSVLRPRHGVSMRRRQDEAHLIYRQPLEPQYRSAAGRA